jgi:hypothetical protein
VKIAGGARVAILVVTKQQIGLALQLEKKRDN